MLLISAYAMGMLDTMDLGVFKRLETWKAFAIAAVMFVSISFAALSMFDSMDDIFQSDAEPEPIPNMVFESLNRTRIWVQNTNRIKPLQFTDIKRQTGYCVVTCPQNPNAPTLFFQISIREKNLNRKIQPSTRRRFY